MKKFIAGLILAIVFVILVVAIMQEEVLAIIVFTALLIGIAFSATIWAIKTLLDD
jgi:xanthosine utilization system XapX-like protein